MSQTLAEIVERVLEPETPVVWLDPGTREELWAALPKALEAQGFRIYVLDGVTDHRTLMSSILTLVGAGANVRPELNALKDVLLSLEDAGPLGWALIFRQPYALRQNDEAAFEDFLEVVETAHDIRMERRGKRFKLILAD